MIGKAVAKIPGAQKLGRYAAEKAVRLDAAVMAEFSRDSLAKTGRSLKPLFSYASKIKSAGASSANLPVLYDSKFALQQLKRKYDLTPAVDTGQPILFGQKAVSPAFSKAGHFKGADIDTVAEDLLNPNTKLSVEAFYVKYIWVNGEKVVVNNRSLTTLSRAGMKPFRPEDMTGRLSEADMSDPDSLLNVLYRLEEMGGKPSTRMPVRYSKNRNSPIKRVVELSK